MYALGVERLPLIVAWRDDGGMAAAATKCPLPAWWTLSKSSDRPKRRQWPEGLKRQIVAEAFGAGLVGFDCGGAMT
jgi:hypothetical protein